MGHKDEDCAALKRVLGKPRESPSVRCKNGGGVTECVANLDGDPSVPQKVKAQRAEEAEGAADIEMDEVKSGANKITDKISTPILCSAKTG